MAFKADAITHWPKNGDRVRKKLAVGQMAAPRIGGTLHSRRNLRDNVESSPGGAGWGGQRFRKRSASMAALHPLAAAQMA